MKVSWDDDIPIYEMENKINLKPPTRHVLLWDVAQSDHILILEPHLKFLKNVVWNIICISPNGNTPIGTADNCSRFLSQFQQFQQFYGFLKIITPGFLLQFPQRLWNSAFQIVCRSSTSRIQTRALGYPAQVLQGADTWAARNCREFRNLHAALSRCHSYCA